MTMFFREYDVAEETTGTDAIDRATLTAIYSTHIKNIISVIVYRDNITNITCNQCAVKHHKNND